MVARKPKPESVTTEELGKIVLDDMRTWTPDQKAHARAKLDREFPPGEKAAARAALRKQADLSSLAGRAEHLHGLAFAAQLVKSEEECFREVMDFFEKLKAEDVKYKM
jgi:hypothetical protein